LGEDLKLDSYAISAESDYRKNIDSVLEEIQNY
jgi:hypothetical protein